MSFADAFNAPLVLAVGGAEYRFAFLAMDDHAAMSREISQQQKQEALARTALNNKAERENIVRFFDGVSLDLNEIAASATTVDGAGRFIRKSLARGGHAPGDADRFLTDYALENGYLAIGRLAMRISRLFAPTKEDVARAFPNGSPASESGQADAGANPGSQSTGASSAEMPGDPSAAQTQGA